MSPCSTNRLTQSVCDPSRCAWAWFKTGWKKSSTLQLSAEDPCFLSGSTNPPSVLLRRMQRTLWAAVCWKVSKCLMAHFKHAMKRFKTLNKHSELWTNKNSIMIYTKKIQREIMSQINVKRGYLGMLETLGACGSLGTCLWMLNLSSSLLNSKLPVSNFLFHVLPLPWCCLTTFPNQWA